MWSLLFWARCVARQLFANLISPLLLANLDRTQIDPVDKTLVIDQVTIADQATYVCEGENNIGSARSTATITVNCKYSLTCCCCCCYWRRQASMIGPVTNDASSEQLKVRHSSIACSTRSSAACAQRRQLDSAQTERLRLQTGQSSPAHCRSAGPTNASSQMGGVAFDSLIEVHNLISSFCAYTCKRSCADVAAAANRSVAVLWSVVDSPGAADSSARCGPAAGQGVQAQITLLAIVAFEYVRVAAVAGLCAFVYAVELWRRAVKI